MKRFLLTLILPLLLSSMVQTSCNRVVVKSQNPEVAASLTRYVDPFIGTGGHGHVFLGAHVPFGAVQTGPNNYYKGWDWCSGYHYSDSILIGFSQLHLSGVGIGDLGDVLVTPYSGEIKSSPGTVKEPLSGYASLFSHQDEIAKAGYYSVLLKRNNIKAELTATERVALHRYTFPASDQSHIAVNLAIGTGWDKPVETFFKKINDQTFTGYRFSTGWAKDQRVYFAIRLSKPIQSLQLFDNETSLSADSARGEKITGILNFPTAQAEQVLVKIGISPVSQQNALNNIEAEVKDWNFEQIVQAADSLWNKELGKVIVKTQNEHALRTFYTALYHAYTHPVIFDDHNGDYQGADRLIYHQPGKDTYSVFSLWDTYRAEQPLFTLVQPERVGDMINSMLNIYKQQGKLPIWHLMGNETDCMVGYPAIPVVADAFFKDIKGFDPILAYEAVKASSMRDDFGMNYIKEKGYIPADKEKESVSKALEYCIADWCIAQMAKKLDKKEDYEIYSIRAGLYARYFDPKRQFIRPVMDNGKFREPFSPFVSVHEWGDYTEGNAWQYTWAVPQDVEGLVKLFGGEKNFVTKLDSLFTVKGDMGEKASADISGLIGQYAHGNEPSHHITFLYAYVGQQWKTARLNRLIQTTLYADAPDGLSGNEDCGQMSAWYILSSMGFYPCNPANGAFIFGSPLFDQVTLNLPGDKQFTIKTLDNGDTNPYIQSMALNGKPYDLSYITYKNIMKGGLLEIKMGPNPNKQFGAAPNTRPKSEISE